MQNGIPEGTALSGRSTALLSPFRTRADLALVPEWIEWLGLALNAEPVRLAAPPHDFAQQTHALSAHGVLPLLYVRLRDDPQWRDLPPDLHASLAGAFQQSAARSFLLDGELVRIGTNQGGLALLKGSAVGRLIYPNPALRPVSDVDLLVRREDVVGVQARLAELGYAGHGLTSHRRLGGVARRYRAEMQLAADVAGCGRLLVELHWALVEAPYYVERMQADDLWNGAVPVAGMPGFLMPRPVVLLAHACAHLSMHHSSDLRLIWLVDVDRLARLPGLDWNEVLGAAERWKLGFALHITLTTAGRWLGTPIPGFVTTGLAELSRDPIAVSSWGLGDDTRGRALRRAVRSLTALGPIDGTRYAAWLALRMLLRPLELALLRRTSGQP